MNHSNIYNPLVLEGFHNYCPGFLTKRKHIDSVNLFHYFSDLHHFSMFRAMLYRQTLPNAVVFPTIRS